ncbi:DNA polymerase [Sphingomonas naasensis]|uniref:Uracil-DNA glycosylase n=1 Tax=Sphingomonas naasensis TaxID=1344951 RepID=A0A4S1WR43_9SPHN|nr:uracil-DNA glycosylase family protein [Sphingomonas naasensis]NIJ18582.1 DNA polymerase [Sphingomonas naasensis]TGX45831.1 uracil-DNA glycosylase [Sphingomonas naasensis]
MGGEPVQDWQKAVASTLDWWCDAGVDMLVADEVRDWLARTPPPAQAATAPAAVAEPVVEALPDTLDAFVAWRLGDTAPEAGGHAPRLAPTGPADAEWVLITDVPEAEDSDTLLSGAAGRLLDRMLAAVGQSRESVYLLPLAWARPVTGRIAAEEEARLLELARHHLSLLEPKRLFLLGQSASRVVRETSGGRPDNRIHGINHFGARTLAVASYPPRWLLEKPAAKSEAWKHLLLLSRGTAE